MGEKEEAKVEVQLVRSRLDRENFPSGRRRSGSSSSHRGTSSLASMDLRAIRWPTALRKFGSIHVSQWTPEPGNYYEPAGQHNYGDEIYYF